MYDSNINPYLVRALEHTVGMMRDHLSQFSPSEFDLRPDPERFSLREVICHLADWEPIMLARMKVGVDTTGGAIQAFDEGQMAIDHDYASKDPMIVISDWEASRDKTIAFVEALSEEQMANEVVHPERGRMTVSDIANMIVCHDIYHLEQVASMRKHPKVVDTW